VKNQERIDNLVETITSGNADGALFEMLNRKASELRMEREKLLVEQRHLQEALAHLQSGLNAETFRSQLISWADVMQEARPEKQRLIRLLVRKIEWQSEGNQTIEFFALPQLPQESRQIKNEKTSPETNQDWFATSVRYGCPGRIRTSDQSVNSRPLYH
jgi:hypothetical protein